MKTVAVLLALALAAELTHADNVNFFKNDFVPQLLAGALGKKIKEFIESFKDTMKTGNDTLGIPQMDPLFLKHQKFDVVDEIITASGEINDLQVKGLSEFEIQDVDLKLGGWRFSINLTWPNLEATTLFDNLNLKIADYIPIVGTGDAKIQAKNLTFATNALLKVNTKNRTIELLSIENTKVSLEAFKLDAKGLYDDEDLSKYISDIISKVVPPSVDDLQEEIVTRVDKIMLDLGRQLLPSVADIIMEIIMPSKP